jgi:hypothetical protein
MAGFYNGRHHTTVCHAIRRMEAMRGVNSEVGSPPRALTEEIKASPAGDCQIRLLERPAASRSLRSTAMNEEFVDARAERLIHRLRFIIEEAVAVRRLQP